MVNRLISQKINIDELSARDADKLTDYQSLSQKPLTDEAKKLKASMRAHTAKRMISLRASPDDIDAVKRHATKIGLPYQTYLALMIRQLAQGKIEMKI
ncbi:MAG: hypothetical protein WCO78_04490 [Candidatus Roizmanbacteria bacterium]